MYAGVIPLQIDSVVYRSDNRRRRALPPARRGQLYARAQALGCNKIAPGHHFDDVIETTLMGMLWGGQLRGMMPMLRSTNYPGMELIRPIRRAGAAGGTGARINRPRKSLHGVFSAEKHFARPLPPQNQSNVHSSSGSSFIRASRAFFWPSTAARRLFLYMVWPSFTMS